MVQAKRVSAMFPRRCRAQAALPCSFAAPLPRGCSRRSFSAAGVGTHQSVPAPDACILFAGKKTRGPWLLVLRLGSLFFSPLVRVFGMAPASSGDLAPSVGHGWRLVYSCCPPCADCLGWGWGFDVAVLLLLTQRAPALVQQVYCHVGYQLIAMFSAM